MFAGAQASQAAVEASRIGEVVGGDKRQAMARDGADWQTFPEDGPAPHLRVERKFNLLAGKKVDDGPPVNTRLALYQAKVDAPPKDDHPVFLTADHMEGRTDDVMEAEGNVEYRKIGSLLFADHLTYWPLDDEVEATGNVRLIQGQDEMHISGPHMKMKLSEQIGSFDDAEYKFTKEVTNKFYRPITAVTTAISVSTSTSGAPLMLNVPSGYGLPTTTPPRRPSDSYGHAEKIEFEGENRIHLDEATFSSCKPAERDWYVRAQELDLDYDQGAADTKNATVYFKDTPIFYTPVGSFSLDRSRHSGFLAGNFAASTKNGLDVTVPYYWNIAPNYDATLYPRYMSKRGFQLGAETQYVNYNYRGGAKFEYLPNDDIENRTRFAYSLMHTQNLGQGLSLAINWNRVSDDRYWQDFSSRLLQTSQSQLPQNLTLGYSRGSWWSASVAMARYQTLSPDPANPVARPYFIEPALAFSGRLLDIAGYGDFGVIAQYARFTHPTLVEGSRAVAYPTIAVPYVDPAFIIVPKFGLHLTQYSLEHVTSDLDAQRTRAVPIFSLDSQATFERPVQWQGHDFLQTLEPRLFYVYIPYRNQDRIPVFDSALGDFNFAQIFNENRYIGNDRINDANQLTAAVTTRMLDATTGAERFKAMIGQRYYFQRQRVTIPGETTRVDSFSNFLAAFSGTVMPKTYVDAAWEYNNRESQSDRLSLGVRYQPEMAKVVSASYRLTRDALGTGQVDQVDLAGQWPITKQWYAVGRYNYSLRDKQLLEGIAGVEYNASCWAARFVVQRLTALSGSPNTTFFFQLELNDFANVGSNPIGLLRRTIPGYGKVNELPTTGSLITNE